MRPDGSVADRVDALNARHGGKGGADAIRAALADPAAGRVALVSSFGAESVVLLHMVAEVAPDLPVLFVDTEMLFAETIAYQQEIARSLGLTGIRRITADPEELAFEDPDNTLHQFNTDACCDLRKTRPLERALKEFDAWITGRKRFQATTRATLDLFEAEGDSRIKINPLADWTPAEVDTYMTRHDLPRHPLVAKGYPSIGCAPCTSPVKPGEDPRAGRWRGQAKVECGIHFIDGKAVRMPKDKENAA